MMMVRSSVGSEEKAESLPPISVPINRLVGRNSLRLLTRKPTLVAPYRQDVRNNSAFEEEEDEEVDDDDDEE